MVYLTSFPLNEDHIHRPLFYSHSIRILLLPLFPSPFSSSSIVFPFSGHSLLRFTNSIQFTELSLLDWITERDWNSQCIRCTFSSPSDPWSTTVVSLWSVLFSIPSLSLLLLQEISMMGELWEMNNLLVSHTQQWNQWHLVFVALFRKLLTLRSPPDPFPPSILPISPPSRHLQYSRLSFQYHHEFLTNSRRISANFEGRAK